MNIAIAKFGQTIKFDIGLTGGTNDGGNHEPPLLYNKLFELNPQNNYYIIGASNFSRLPDDVKSKINKNNNVFDCMTPGDYKSPYEYLIKNNIKLDAGIIFGGTASRHNIPSSVQYENGETNKPLVMQVNYSANVIYTLNKTNIPWLLITCDPRYTNLSTHDLINIPKYNLSQINSTCTFKYMDGFDSDKLNIRADLPMIEKEVPLVYAATETIMSIDSIFKKKPEKKSLFSMSYSKSVKPDSGDSHSDFVIVANQSKYCKLDRLAEIKKYIGDLDVAIYGRYDDESVFDDKRFKGSLPLDKLYEVLKQSEFTFIIPIDYDWATSKYIECINNDLIPFFHPAYDTQKNVPIPDYLRINSPEELHSKLDELRHNPELKAKIKKECKELIGEDMRSGKFMNDALNSWLNKII